jgi:hypothetical protein
LALEKEPQVVEALGEAAQNFRGQGAVGDGFAKLDERVGEGLHAPTVLGDGENTLAQRAELGVDELDASLTVADYCGTTRNLGFYDKLNLSCKVHNWS